MASTCILHPALQSSDQLFLKASFTQVAQEAWICLPEKLLLINISFCSKTKDWSDIKRLQLTI